MDFTNKTVLVTGAASGIGLRISERFLAAGAAVVGTDINAVELAALAPKLGDRFEGKVCDAGDVGQIRELLGGMDRLDVLVNNAGIGILEDPEALDETAFDKQHDVLIKGPIFHVKYAASLLRASANGSVINISSASAIVSLHGYTAYGTAKAAIVKFTEDSAVTVPGIRHNAILPGLIDTPILEKAYGIEARAQLNGAAQACPVPRLGTPEDIASATLFLASDEASFINGTSLVVDGGLSKVHFMSLA